MFNYSVAVNEAPNHRNGPAYLSFAQHKGAAGGAGDVRSVRLPLIADTAHAVDIYEIVAGGQRRALGQIAGDGDAAGRGFVGYLDSRLTCQAINMPSIVRVSCYDSDLVADFGPLRDKGAVGRACDVCAVRPPLVGKCKSVKRIIKII